MKPYIIFNTIDEMKNLTNARPKPYEELNSHLTPEDPRVDSILLKNNYQKDFIIKDITRTNFIRS